jgi:hypothetical protein
MERRKMTPKPVWLNDIERDAWIERNCRICFQPDEAIRRVTDSGPGCPHLARSLENKLPTPWTRRRNAVMGETYRCSEFAPKPAVNRRGKVTEEIEPLFPIDPIGCTRNDQGEVCNCDDARECGNAYPLERNLVPVDGWPDWRAEQRKTKEGDHL